MANYLKRMQIALRASLNALKTSHLQCPPRPRHALLQDNSALLAGLPALP